MSDVSRDKEQFFRGLGSGLGKGRQSGRSALSTESRNAVELLESRVMLSAQPTQVTATEDTAGNIQVSFPGTSGGPYQVLRSVDGGAFADVGAPPTTSTAAGGYTYQDTGPLTTGDTYQYEAVVSGTTPTTPATSNTVDYLNTSLVTHLSFTSGETDLNFNNGGGDAATVNASNQLQLTDGTDGEDNSVLTSGSVQINNSTWETSFDFEIANPGADGFTFVVENNGDTAVGASGGGLGYSGFPGTSIAVGFNQYNSVTQTNFGANGTFLPYVDMSGTLGNAFHAANPTDTFQVSLGYNGANGDLLEAIRDTQTGEGFSQTLTPASYASLGVTQSSLNTLFASPVYVGFTGATGGVTSTQTVNDWTFDTTPITGPSQPPAVAATQDINGDIQVSFPAAATNGFTGVTYQVLRSVNGGAYTAVGSPIAASSAVSYTLQDSGPFTNGDTYQYEAVVSGTTPAGAATSNAIDYLYEPSFTHSSFTSGESDLQFNNASGDAASVNSANQLQLTDGTGNISNSVFETSAVQVNSSWETSFDFEITDPGADGFTFAIQNVSNTATGGGGGALGYTGGGNVAAGGIPNSIAVAFNQYNTVTQTAIGANGVLAPYVNMSGTLGNAFHVVNPATTTTDTFQITLSYNGASGDLLETVRDTATGLGFSQTFTPASYASLGVTQSSLNTLFASPVYVGFTGATGGVTSIQTINDWTFNTLPATSPAQPPTVAATQDTNGNIQVSFPAPATYGFTGVTYQVLRSVNGGAYTALGSPIAASSAASYTLQDSGPFTNGDTYQYEAVISGTTPASPAASDSVYYLYNPLVALASFTPGESDLQFNNAGGDAASVNGANQLQLTDGTGGISNSVFETSPVQINSNWETSFDFEITDPGADGFTFTIQNNSDTATGGGGGSLGYAGIPNSIAIAFNQYNTVTQTAIGANGALAPYVNMSSTLGNAFHVVNPATTTTDTFQVSLAYNGTSGDLLETVRDTATGLGSSQTFTPASYASLGVTQASLNTLFGSPVYVGFTGATGGVTSIQTINDWTFNTTVSSLPAGVTASSGAVYTYNSTTNALSLSSGTLTFNNVGTASSLALNVTADGTVSNLLFDTTTYLNSLTLTDGAMAQLVQSGTDTVTGSGSSADLIDFGTTLTQANTNVLVLNSLSIPDAGATLSDGATNSAQGTLDLTNNAMILNYTPGTSAAALAAADTLTGDGSDGGVWNGTGITSSNAEADNNNNGYTAIGVADNGDLGYNTFAGQNVSSGAQILFMYTYNGDADLNGILNVTDTISYEDGLKTHPGGPAGSGWEYGALDYGATPQGSLSDLQFLEAGFRGYRANGAINISES